MAISRHYDELCETWVVKVPGRGSVTFYGPGHHVASALVQAGLSGRPPVFDEGDGPDWIGGVEEIPGTGGDDRVGVRWRSPKLGIARFCGAAEADGADDAGLKLDCLAILRDWPVAA